MKYLPITLIVTLSSSLFVALVINPVLILVFMQLDKGERPNHKRIFITLLAVVLLALSLLFLGYTLMGNLILIFGFIFLLNVYLLAPGSRKFQNKFLPWLEAKYSILLKFSLSGSWSYVFFFGTTGLLILSFLLMNIFPPRVVFFLKQIQNTSTYLLNSQWERT